MRMEDWIKGNFQCIVTAKYIEKYKCIDARVYLPKEILGTSLKLGPFPTIHRTLIHVYIYMYVYTYCPTGNGIFLIAYIRTC